MTPEVSVIMSIKEDEPFLGESIKSILAQTYRNFEFIIVNDGGGPAVNNVIESFGDPRISIISRPRKGLTKSLNEAIECSSGEYIARIDAGDYSLPRRIELQAALMKENSNIGLVGTSYSEITSTGKKLTETILPSDPIQLKKSLLYQNQFRHGSVMFRRKSIDDVGWYRQEFVKAQDYDLWLRIADRYEITNIKEILYIHRLDIDSTSIALKQQQNYYAKIARKCSIARNKGEEEPLELLGQRNNAGSVTERNLDREKTFHYNFHLGRILFFERKLKLARKHFIKSFSIKPYKLFAAAFIIASFLPTSLIDKIDPLWQVIKRKCKLRI
ncbi:MAG TPA: glycosyltransferase [Candidatus Krumholzibacteriaceae bacterium]|nr:glycosyltransferase [Candidatus Krumholzibacteriaceae bacterium]